MSNKELLPCPFCGGETKLDKRGQYCYGIVCISCGAKSPDFQTETNAIKSWNDYTKDWLKMEQIEPEISLDGIHPDLINGVLEVKHNSSEIPNSSKEMPLVPKWQENEALAWIIIEINQFSVLFFDYRKESKQLIFSVRSKIEDIYHYEELGKFNTLKEAKQKVNECIKDLGERLVYFANNIRTEE